MTDNWTGIHPGFTEELVKDWKDFGFDYEQVEEWINVRGFSLKDAEFAAYIGDKELIINELEKHELDELRKEYNEAVKANNFAEETYFKRKIEEVIDPNDRKWKNISLGFTPELVREWQEHNFSYEEIKDWINIGMKITDAGFCAWLRDEVEVDSELVLNNGDFEQLRSEYKKYLTFTQLIQPVK